MKKITNALFYLITSIILLLSFVMLIVETRLLISTDFMLSENVFIGFIKHLLRLIISISFFLVMIIELIKSLKRFEFIKQYLFFIEWMLFVSSVVVLVYGTNYIGILTFTLSSIFILLKTIIVLSNQK